MSLQPAPSRQIVWQSVITVISAAILIGAEVFGAAFAGGWALAILFGLDDTGAHILQAVLFAARRLRHGGVRPRRPARRAVHSSAPRLERCEKALRRRRKIDHTSLSKINIRSDTGSSRASKRRARKQLLGKFVLSLKKLLRSGLKTLISVSAQFRTCLWSCVSR